MESVRSKSLHTRFSELVRKSLISLITFRIAIASQEYFTGYHFLHITVHIFLYRVHTFQKALSSSYYKLLSRETRLLYNQKCHHGLAELTVAFPWAGLENKV